MNYPLTGVLLICFTIVLNVSPFTKNPIRNRVPQINSDHPIPQRHQSEFPSRFQIEENVYDPIRPVIKLSQVFVRWASIYEAPTARRVSPASLGNDDGKIQPQEPGSTDHAGTGRDTIIGIWAPDNGTCSDRTFRDGVLPAVISAHGARAGKTHCVFKNQKQTEKDWRVVANCSNLDEHWTANVRLTVKGNRLIWTSKRGTQVYTRCKPDARIADAG